MEYEIDVKFSSSSASTSPIRSTKPLSVAPLSNNAPSSTSSSPLALLTKKDLLKNLERSDNSSLLALPSDSNSSSSLTVPSLLSQKLKSNLLGEEEEYDNALFKKPAAINTSKMNNGNAINCKKQPPSSNFTPFQKGNKDLKAADDMLDLFTMKSPIGALATDLDVNFSLKAGRCVISSIICYPLLIYAILTINHLRIVPRHRKIHDDCYLKILPHAPTFPTTTTRHR